MSEIVYRDDHGMLEREGAGYWLALEGWPGRIYVAAGSNTDSRAWLCAALERATETQRAFLEMRVPVKTVGLADLAAPAPAPDAGTSVADTLVREHARLAEENRNLHAFIADQRLRASPAPAEAPTMEQLACATRIAAQEQFSGYGVFWSQYREGSGDHDAHVAHLCINVNDLWGWACADCEALRWEDVFLFEARMKECAPERQEESMAATAYVAVLRGDEPQNWLDHYSRDDKGAYRKIGPEDEARWEAHKAWWHAALLRPGAGGEAKE